MISSLRVAFLLLLALFSFACVDKSYVAGPGKDTDARLGISVALGELALEGEITAVRIVVAYASGNGTLVLADRTEPYSEGQSRDFALNLDITNCLRTQINAINGCTVQVRVDVLSGTRVLAHDELPPLLVSPGQTTTAPALAARSATSLRLRLNSASVPSPLALTPGNTAALVGEPLDAAGAPIAGRTITWTSSAPTIASVSAAGLITAITTGSANIIASIGSGSGIIQTSVAVNVSPLAPVTVILTPTAANIAVGATQSISASVRDAGGVAITPAPSVTWSSSAQTVATVSSAGLVTAVAPGSASITARTANGITGTAIITVFAVPAVVQLTPPTASVAVGATQNISAVVRDAAGTQITPTPALTWSTSASTVATVSSAGVVSAVSPGTATITARTSSGVAGTTTITVFAVAATLQLTPSPVSIGIEQMLQLVATVRDATGAQITPTPALTWESSALTVATVSTSGVVTGVSFGSATVTARTANGTAGSATVTVAPSGSFRGRVYDYETNNGVLGATVSITSNGQVVRSVITDGQGNYDTGLLAGGPFDLRAAANGYVPVDIQNNTLNGTRVLEAVPLVRVATGGGVIAGTVFNATTNRFITTTATLELYSGMNNTSGNPVATTSSGQGGTYQFTNVPAGTYTLVGRATGYSSGSRSVSSVGGGRFAINQNLFLSPTSVVGSLRIVLTWGDTPQDLDSHLVGPVSGESTFWVWWNNVGSCTAQPFACLDVDETEGRGPETITIAQRNPGRYVYSVHNFSAGANNPLDRGLSQSNARVDVYGSTGLIQSFAVPAQSGTLWTVFEWDGTTIRAINTVSGNPPPARESIGGSSILLAPESLPWPRKAKR